MSPSVGSVWRFEDAPYKGHVVVRRVYMSIVSSNPLVEVVLPDEVDTRRVQTFPVSYFNGRLVPA